MITEVGKLMLDMLRTQWEIFRYPKGVEIQVPVQARSTKPLLVLTPPNALAWGWKDQSYSPCR